MEEPLSGQIGRLQSDVEHIKNDVSEIKVDLRRLDAKIDDLRDSLTQKIDGLRDSLTGKIDGLRQELSSLKVWALLLYFGLAGTLLLVLAKGFKWI